MSEPELAADWDACGQADCDGLAHVQYYWPGKGRMFACLICATGVLKVAEVIGLPLLMEPYFRIKQPAQQRS